MPVGDGLGPHTHDVAARLWLRQAEPGPHLTARDASHVPLLLLLAPGDQHRTGRQPGQQQHERRGVGVLRDLLDRDRQPEDARPRAPVGLGDHEAEEAGVAEDLEEVLRVFAGGVDLAGPGRDSLPGDATHGRLELRQLRGEGEIHEGSSLPAARDQLGNPMLPEMGQNRAPPTAETTHLDSPDRPRARDGTEPRTPHRRNDPSRRPGRPRPRRPRWAGRPGI